MHWAAGLELGIEGLQMVADPHACSATPRRMPATLETPAVQAHAMTFAHCQVVILLCLGDILHQYLDPCAPFSYGHVQALRSIHDLGLLHGDVRADNVVLQQTSRGTYRVG